MRVYMKEMLIEGAQLAGENPLPMFRERQRNRDVQVVGEAVTDAQRHLAGWETGNCYLPYRLQDRYTRHREQMSIKSIVLENEHLRAVFLPTYGGRLYALYDKGRQREILYKNPVFQPANLAIRNAWFSGGIEWNISQFGHTFTTCDHVHAAKLQDDHGNDFLRIYEFERCKQLFWQIDFHLPSGERQMTAHVQIVNGSKQDVPMYWWTNIALQETADTRVFSSTAEVLYIDHKLGGFGIGKLPELPTVPGKDVSYPLRFPYANEYFFQVAEEEASPWEAASYADGRLFYERSTPLLRYRKMFCWGSHIGGRRWCDFLARPGEGDYVEIQAGLSPTQLHGYKMEAGGAFSFTQAFGMTDVDANLCNRKEWELARRYVAERVEAELPQGELHARHIRLQGLADRQPKPEQMLHSGSGWGRLEQLRRQYSREGNVPTGQLFLHETLDAHQADWLELLEHGRMKESDPDSAPLSWMVQREWQQLLEDSLAHDTSDHWATWLDIGVMRYEAGQEAEARIAWEHSVQLRPSVWALRNLAYALKEQGNTSRALDAMEQAYNLTGSFPDQALAEEYLSLLLLDGQYEKAWVLFEEMEQQFPAGERLQLIAGQAALHLDKQAFLGRMFATEWAVVREGEMILIDLWYENEARRLAADKGEVLTETHRQEARENCPPPPTIDFRMS